MSRSKRKPTPRRQARVQPPVPPAPQQSATGLISLDEIKSFVSLDEIGTDEPQPKKLDPSFDLHADPFADLYA